MGWDNELREASLRIQTLGVCGSHFPKAGFMKMQSQGRQAPLLPALPPCANRVLRVGRN